MIYLVEFLGNFGYNGGIESAQLFCFISGGDPYEIIEPYTTEIDCYLCHGV